MKRVISLLMTVLACACGAATSTAPSGARLLISLAAAQVSAVRGSRLSVSTAVTRIDGAASPITVTVSAPTGVTASVASESTNGTTTTAALLIVVGSTTLPGQYTIVIRASAAGYPDASSQFIVDLNDLPPP